MNAILIGKGERPVHLLAKYGNRHGLIAGATGTGKTISLMMLAEGFSRLGVPVFVADVKGDVSGLAFPGTPNSNVQDRVARVGIEGYTHEASPVLFWDLYGRAGHPPRATISEVGPMLLGRMLGVNETQSGVLEVAFRLADEQGLLLLDLEDLRAVLGFVAEHRSEVSTRYGLVAAQSVAAIQRALLPFEREGGDALFGEPALDMSDLFRTDLSVRGVISILAADQLVLKPRLYSSFRLWLLSELLENLPEVGDLDKPKLVFVFDEAHLLFDGAPAVLRERVEQVVRIIRSKGVGVYFCSQLPDDVPSEILGQLGNRIQHALRAYTPRDQKAVRTAAETFVANPAFNVAKSFHRSASAKRSSRPFRRRECPCRSSAPSCVRRAAGWEPLRKRSAQPCGRAVRWVASTIHASTASRPSRSCSSESSPEEQVPIRRHLRHPHPMAHRGATGCWARDGRQGLLETMAKQAARTVGGQLGRQILRGVLGGIAGGSRR